jgi:hypothetical protein
MTRETKAERERREAHHMSNLDGVGSQYRAAAGLPPRESNETTDYSDPDNTPEKDVYSGPEGGYGGEENQPEPVEYSGGTSPGDPATLAAVDAGEGPQSASGQLDAEGELVEVDVEEKRDEAPKDGE